MVRFRLVIGLICIAIAIWMFLSDEVSENPASAIVILIIGLIVVATARFKNSKN